MRGHGAFAQVRPSSWVASHRVTYFRTLGIKLVATPTATSTLHKVLTQVTAVASAFTMASAWTTRTATTKTPQVTRIARP